MIRSLSANSLSAVVSPPPCLPGVSCPGPSTRPPAEHAVSSSLLQASLFTSLLATGSFSATPSALSSSHHKASQSTCLSSRGSGLVPGQRSRGVKSSSGVSSRLQLLREECSWPKAIFLADSLALSNSPAFSVAAGVGWGVSYKSDAESQWQ